MATVDWASDSEEETSFDTTDTNTITDEPRDLREDEIDGIINGLRFGLNHTRVQENIIHIHREKTRRKLVSIKIRPSKIPELKKIIMHQFYASLIAPGEAVGVNAAQCIGEPTTQLTLNSVAPTERILIQDMQGITSLVSIGDWIDNLLSKSSAVQHIPKNRTQYLELDEPVFTPSPDSNGKVTWELVTAITKHLPVGDLVTITTNSGRSVTATQSKSMLIWEDGTLVQKGGADVQIGDLCPIICDFPEAKMPQSHMNLRQYLSPKDWVYGTELTQLYDVWSADTRSNRIGFWKTDRMAALPYSRGDAAIEAAKLGVAQPGFVYPKKNLTSVKSKIPEQFPLSEHFGQVVGLYLAEGWATNTFVGISNNSTVILDLVRDWCDQYSITHHTVTTNSNRGTSTDLKIHSVLLARWFKEWLGTGSANKNMPREAFTSKLEFARGVLDGYFAGDGTVNKRDGYLVVSSASRDLITGFGSLCARFSIMGKQSGHQPAKNNIGSKHIQYVNTFSIRNSFATLWKVQIGSCHPDKASALAKFIKDDHSMPYGRIWSRAGNIVLDPIVSIEYVPATEYVYDLTVPSTTNFSLWNGLGVADTFHSAGISAKNVTLGFPRARELFNATKSPSNPSCTIFFTRDNEVPEQLHTIADKFVQNNVDSLLKEHGGWQVFAPEDYNLEYWHQAWYQLHPDSPDLTEDEWILRLSFNVGRLYENNVTVKQISQNLEGSYSDLRCIPSPLNLGIIDVVVNCSEISINGQRSAELQDITDDQKARQFYMSHIVSPKIRGHICCGISGITRTYRRKAKIDEPFNGFALKPEIANRLKNDEEWILDTDGTNLAEIFIQPGVDPYRTMSNDMWEILSILGIEAARQYLFLEFLNIANAGGISINPVHFQTLVSKMTYTGAIRAIARFGVETSQYGPIARATFEEVMSQLVTSAMFSERDDLNGISSNIVLGTKINAGTGTIQLQNIPLTIVPPSQKSAQKRASKKASSKGSTISTPGQVPVRPRIQPPVQITQDKK